MKIYQVDAFTDKPFTGNPAGVCVLPGPKNDVWMQNVAAEMNLSETAFLMQEGDGFRLRWFTPAVEVELCGHATLASAHVLWEIGRLAGHEPARFHTLSGLLTAERRGEAIELDFPATPDEPADAPAGLAEILGARVVNFRSSRFDHLAELESEAVVRGLRPDFTRLKSLPVRGIMVTSRATSPGFDFVSRFFGPAVGIDEDPVTGSAHCCLGPYWSKRLGKTDMRACQASRRGGVVGVTVIGDRVLLRGQAVTVMAAELTAE
ncbi:MAG: PhzF family phenazine biosynthesis protein [Desulfobacterales bacterium]|jgi:PhzF family phenazine biosynthesis protein|nr:PhzF family phenazine biosynthesis protein [Desulfobacterales bacterium]